jgi:cobalt-zinc-cadmium resistance protein CzcA
MGLNQTDTYLLLAAERVAYEDKGRVAGRSSQGIRYLPGISYSFTQPIEMRVSEMIIGVRGDIAVKIFGPDLEQLNSYATQVEQVLKTISGNQDVYTVQNDGVQYMQVIVDRMQAGRLGLSVEDVQDALRVQIEGQQAGTVIEGNRRTPILFALLNRCGCHLQSFPQFVSLEKTV